VTDLESFDAASERKIESAGLWVGLTAFGVLAVAIYSVDRYLSERFGSVVSGMALYLPAFFAIFVVLPAKSLYVRVALRRLCAARGHVLWSLIQTTVGAW